MFRPLDGGMLKTLLTPREVDRMLRYPRGRSARLARANKIPHITLPDGEIRFDSEAVEDFLVSAGGETARQHEAVLHA